MSEFLRKRSPRAPSLALEESLERAMKIYEKERRHAAPTDVIAQNLGYKNANNGAALSILATLRSFGLLEKAQEGKLAITKDVETYVFAPAEELKSQLRAKWLKTPDIFNELLDSYPEGLPSDATLRYDLIQRGFTPSSAESTLTVFKQSVDFAKFFERTASTSPIADGTETLADSTGKAAAVSLGTLDAQLEHTPAPSMPVDRDDYDRIPVRLAGGRRAWLEIPTPFFAADKKRLIAQIELVFTEDEGEAART